MDPEEAAALKITHLKQDVVNACGTVALLHCLVNTPDIIILQNANVFDEFTAEK